MYQTPKIYGGFKIHVNKKNSKWISQYTCSLNDENVIIVGDLTLNCNSTSKKN